LLLDRFMRLAPWPVYSVDPAPAIALRFIDNIWTLTTYALGGAARVIFTSGLLPQPTLASALARFGIGEATLRAAE